MHGNENLPRGFGTFGSLEFYDEKMSPDLIGFTAEEDIPLPGNVHRYITRRRRMAAAAAASALSPIRRRRTAASSL